MKGAGEFAPQVTGQGGDGVLVGFPGPPPPGFQIPAAQVSLVLFGGKVSGAVADPVAGFFINRSRRTGSAQLMPW